MTIKEAINDAIIKLKSCSGTAWLDAYVILGDIIGKDKAYLIAHDDEILCRKDSQNFEQSIQKRISGMPVQYLTGRQEFMGLDFLVNSSVLIPRADTEILVEEVLKHIRLNKSVDIADIGTGSGCIAVSIAKNVENTSITAVDLSVNALQIAKQNAEMNNVEDRISFIHSNYFEALTGRTFDIIVSNPPYIASEVVESLQPEVKNFEPRTALDGGIDGLNCYRKIIKEAKKYLKRKGLLALEIGFDQAEQVSELIKKEESYCNLKVIKDLAGNNRVITVEYLSNY